MKAMIECLEDIKNRECYWRECAIKTKDVYRADYYLAKALECSAIIKMIQLAMTKSILEGETNDKERDSEPIDGVHPEQSGY